MQLHGNAKTTPLSREELVGRVVHEGQSIHQVARDFGVSHTTVRKWISRWRGEGPRGLDRRRSNAAFDYTRTGGQARPQTMSKVYSVASCPPTRILRGGVGLRSRNSVGRSSGRLPALTWKWMCGAGP